MAVITLSWQYGCLGGVVAEEAARQLGYDLIGKQQINDMLTRDIQRFSQEVDVDNSLKNAEEEIEEGYFHACSDSIRPTPIYYFPSFMRLPAKTGRLSKAMALRQSWPINRRHSASV